MSTRAVYSFYDERNDVFHVYKHHDNYPEGAAEFLTNALDYAWRLPRYEHDEFATAFIAANKHMHGGGVRLTHKPENNVDIEYVYEILQAKNGQMIIKAWKVNFWKEDEPFREQFFYGRLKDFVIKYGDNNTKKTWDDRVKSEHKAYNPDDAERKEYERLKAKFEPVMAL